MQQRRRETAVFCDSCTVKVVHNSHVAMPCCCVLSDNTKILSVFMGYCFICISTMAMLQVLNGLFSNLISLIIIIMVLMI